jgi:hypothetical protein
MKDHESVQPFNIATNLKKTKFYVTCLCVFFMNLEGLNISSIYGVAAIEFFITVIDLL